MRASEIIRIKRSRIPLRVPQVGGRRRWQRYVEGGVWYSRARYFGCPREFRELLRTPAQRACELGVSEDVLTRFVGATDNPIPTADYVAFGPHRWFVTACRRADAIGAPRPDRDAALKTGEMIYATHIFELAIFDIYIRTNTLGVEDRQIYLMIQELTGALGAVAAEVERKQIAPDGLYDAKITGRYRQFAQRAAVTVERAMAAGHFRAVEATYDKLVDLFPDELGAIESELGLRVYPVEESALVLDHGAIAAIVKKLASQSRPRGRRPQRAASRGKEIIREHYKRLTGFDRKGQSGRFGEFVEAVFGHFSIDVPKPDVGRSRRRNK